MPVGSSFSKNDQDIPNLKSAKKQRRPSSAGGSSSLLALDTLNNKNDISNKEEQNNHSASEANCPKSLKSADSQEQTKQTVGEEGQVAQLEEDEKKDFRNPLPPPNPLLPRKNIQRADVPRSGTDLRFLKIPFLQGSNKATQAQGQDYGKYPKKCGISITEYPPHMTLNQIFFGWMNRIDQLASGQVPKGMSPVYQQGSPIVYRRDAGQIAKQTALQQENKVISTICDVRKLIKVTGDSNNNNDDDMSRVSSIPPVFSDNIRPYYVPKDQSDRTLVFESRFQSGNLAIALKANDNQYNLLLQNDINTQGHTQWFFFSVGNTKKSMEVKFNILNLCKSDSLYNHGMKVLAFSVTQKQKSGLGWHRDGKDILYYLNGIKRDNVANYKSYYTLTFTYKFKYTQDTVYFAYSLPYTYSQLQEYLLNISTDPKRAKILNRKTLCNTIAGNKSEILTVTQVAKTHQQGKKKKGVVISSRVHPGQTVGSWMMQGVMEFICSLTSYQAYILRKHFIFKIIPMVNPDGVINGNYRCSLAGCDLNRRWKVPSKVLHPVIYQIKKLLRNMSREREVSLFCDLHGHSRNKNVFMYGCSEPNKLEETRIFPFIMSKLCPFFSFKGSKFGVQKSKQSTARITMWKELRVPNIFTMQASFCGPSEGEFAGSHFSENNLKQIGRDLCRSLLYYCEIQIPKQVKSDNKDLEQYKQAQKIKIFEEEYAPYKGMYDRLKNQLLGKQDLILAGQGGEESGSDDCPSQDNFSDQEIKKVLPKLQKRVKKDLTKKMANSLSKSKAPVIQPRPQPPVIKPQQSPQERKKPDPLRDRKPSTNPPVPDQRRNQTKRASVLDGTQSVPADKNAPKKSTM